MFGTGTACIVSPIDRIYYMGENLMIPTMQQENSVFSRVRKCLTDIQYGRVNHPWAIVID